MFVEIARARSGAEIPFYVIGNGNHAYTALLALLAMV